MTLTGLRRHLREYSGDFQTDDPFCARGYAVRIESADRYLVLRLESNHRHGEEKKEASSLVLFILQQCFFDGMKLFERLRIQDDKDVN
jgi:hypothetical protein